MHTGVSRRHALRLVASGAGLALLAACSPAGQPAPASTVPPAPPQSSGATPVATTPAAKPAAQPTRGGTLRLGIVGDLSTLDPNFPTPVAYSSLWQAFDRLIQNDINMKPQPMLAESWDVSSDLKQLKLNLRKGVQFHTGREFTSDDVKW